jgi:hypothetical protein
MEIRNEERLSQGGAVIGYLLSGEMVGGPLLVR